MLKDEDYLFIKGFFAIGITKICKELKLSRGYLIAGKYQDKEVYKKARREIEKELAKLYLGGK